MIAGLQLVRRFLDTEAQYQLVTEIDAQPWSALLRRRVQQYGAHYDYGRRSIVIDSGELAAAPWPEWGTRLVHKIGEAGIVRAPFDQMIVNEYKPGQGIAPHVDSSDFGPQIVTLSLGSTCMMTFSEVGGGECVDLWLEPGDLMLLTQAGRHLWRHQIKPRKYDLHRGQKVQRGRRISVTLRTVLR